MSKTPALDPLVCLLETSAGLDVLYAVNRMNEKGYNNPRPPLLVCTVYTRLNSKDEKCRDSLRFFISFKAYISYN